MPTPTTRPVPEPLHLACTRTGDRIHVVSLAEDRETRDALCGRTAAVSRQTWDAADRHAGTWCGRCKSLAYAIRSTESIRRENYLRTARDEFERASLTGRDSVTVARNTVEAADRLLDALTARQLRDVDHAMCVLYCAQVVTDADRAIASRVDAERARRADRDGDPR